MNGLGNFIESLNMHMCSIAVQYEIFRDSPFVPGEASDEFGIVLSFRGSGTHSTSFHSTWHYLPMVLNTGWKPPSACIQVSTFSPHLGLIAQSCFLSPYYAVKS